MTTSSPLAARVSICRVQVARTRVNAPKKAGNHAPVGEWLSSSKGE